MDGGATKSTDNGRWTSLMAEAAVIAENALDRQKGVFGFWTVRPDRFLSGSYPNWSDLRG